METMDHATNLISHKFTPAHSGHFRAYRYRHIQRVILRSNCIRIHIGFGVMLARNCFRVIVYANCIGVIHRGNCYRVMFWGNCLSYGIQ